MFDISALIWVAPGVVGLVAYNRKLSRSLPQAQGWPYFFAVVIFGIPYYFFYFLSEYLLETVRANQVIVALLALLFSILFASFLGTLFAKAKNKINPLAGDPFYDSCYLWEDKFVFITLKSNEVYLAILLGWTKNLGFEPSIRVVPFYRGYRDEQAKVHWTFKYPIFEHPENKELITESIIPKEEIRTFSR